MSHMHPLLTLEPHILHLLRCATSETIPRNGASQEVYVSSTFDQMRHSN